MRIFVTGGSGMLGHTFMRLARGTHDVWGSYLTFPVTIAGCHMLPLDLENTRGIKECMTAARPEAVIHTAALTDVDACEKDPIRADRINGKATRDLARIASELGILFVYISTDYVFDGKKGSYKETDAPCPINAYGMSKLSGEEAVREECPEGLVIRTSIFGYNVQPKTGVAEYVINSLKNGKRLARFTDQFSTPIYTGDLSRVILNLLDRRATGMFHVGGGERISRFDFAVKVARAFALSTELVRPAPFVPLQGLAQRPVDTSLSSDKVEAYLKDCLPEVEEGLAKLSEELRSLHDATREGRRDG